MHLFSAVVVALPGAKEVQILTNSTMLHRTMLLKTVVLFRMYP
jgi:hypothetical protein